MSKRTDPYDGEAFHATNRRGTMHQCNCTHCGWKIVPKDQTAKQIDADIDMLKAWMCPEGDAALMRLAGYAIWAKRRAAELWWVAFLSFGLGFGIGLILAGSLQ